MQKTKSKLKSKEVIKVEGPQAVAQIFSQTRDIDMVNPYHLDGDVDMYTEENLSKRKELRNNEDINKEINQIIKVYSFTSQNNSNQQPQDILLEDSYKKIQKLLATILRPDIDQEELKFIVEMDWQHDRQCEKNQGKEGQEANTYYLSKEKVKLALFELIDVWTMSADQAEYISFCRLLRKKLERALKTEK